MRRIVIFKEKTIVNEEIEEKMSAAPRITVHTVERWALALPSNENLKSL